MRVRFRLIVVSRGSGGDRIRADGLAMGPEPRERAIRAAHTQLAEMFRRAD